MKPRQASRKAVPQLIAIAGPSGSGKTYSALKLAAGLAGPGGKVGLIDTENGRGEMYTDSPGILEVLPQGFLYLELPPPFHPARYIEAIDAMEAEGVTVCIIDSGSHEWEGPGGCSEIAEQDKGRWAKAKLANRKYVYRLIYSKMHVIVCLKAREKSKIVAAKDSPDRKEHVIALGVLPIAEKNFVYEMLISLLLDEQTHAASPLKVPEPLAHLFGGEALIGYHTGEQIRQWNQQGATADPIERLAKRARSAAEDGIDAYQAFFSSLSKPERQSIVLIHAECKARAAAVDAQIAASEAEAVPDEAKSPRREATPTLAPIVVSEFPDPLSMDPGLLVSLDGKIYEQSEERTGWVEFHDR